MRLPKAVSGTATTVGGLILGTAATEAALTSTIMIIIISAMAISTFVIPINEMSFTMRVVRDFITNLQFLIRHRRPADRLHRDYYVIGE